MEVELTSEDCMPENGIGVNVREGELGSFSFRSLSLFFSFFSAAKSTPIELVLSLKQGITLNSFPSMRSGKINLSCLFVGVDKEVLEDFLDGDLNSRAFFVGAAVTPLLFSLDFDCWEETTRRDDLLTLWLLLLFTILLPGLAIPLLVATPVLLEPIKFVIPESFWLQGVITFSFVKFDSVKP